MTDEPRCFDSGIVSLELLSRYVAEHNHALTRILALPPMPVVRMATDRFGQTELWSVEVDRSRLAVILC